MKQSALSYFALVLLCLGNISTANDSEISNYRYVVSWGYWDDPVVDKEKWFNMVVRLNGKTIGERKSAFKQLELLPVKKGEHIKLDMPARSRHSNQNVGHWESGFVQCWMKKGALVDWYEGGERFSLHTVTWADFVIDGNVIRNLDECTWIVDGKRIGKGEDFLPMIEQWKQESKLVIQLLTPVEWNSRDYGPGEGNVLLTLGSINAGQKIRVYHIYCLSQPIPAHAADVKYRFIVSMDPWNGRDWDVWEKLDVRLDGKSIGTPRVAFKKLDDLPAKSGEHIKLELSSRLGEGTTGQVYRRSNFIHRWMAKGALVDLYENGKKLNSRIVTWKPFDWKKWIENGGLLKTMDDVTWVVDGKEIGDGKELLKYIAQWEEVKDTVIQVLEPSHSVHPKYFLPEDGIAYSKLQELSAQKRLRMFRITPDDVYYTGKPPTSQQ